MDMHRFALCVSFLALTAPVTAADDDPGPKAQSLRLELDLVDGSHIIGIPALATVPVETPYAKMYVPLKQIASMRIGECRFPGSRKGKREQKGRH